MTLFRSSARLGALVVACLAAGCSQAPPLEVPDEHVQMKAEWEAEAGVEPQEVTAPPEDLVSGDDYVITAAPRYPVPEEELRAPVEGADGSGEGATAERGASDDTVIRIEGGSDRRRQPRTLYEASVLAKERRKEAERARIVITDENLHEYQRGSVTIGGDPDARVGGSEEGEAEADEVDEAGANDDGQGGQDEAYWRSTVLDLRTRMRDAVDDLEALDERAAELRRQFYAQDDPYVRDGDIKPAWDRTLDRVQETRREILDLTRELDATLQAGREAGALPGWLREGGELEPARREMLSLGLDTRSGGVHEPGEPSVVETPVLILEEEEPPA